MRGAAIISLFLCFCHHRPVNGHRKTPWNDSVNTPTWPSRPCPGSCSAPPAAGAAAPGSSCSGPGRSAAGRTARTSAAAACPRPGRSGRPGAGRRRSCRGRRRTGSSPLRATAVTWPRTPSATKTPRRSVSPEKNVGLLAADHLDLDLRHERLGRGRRGPSPGPGRSSGSSSTSQLQRARPGRSPRRSRSSPRTITR